MKPSMDRSRQLLAQMIATNESTAGMAIRVQGQSLILAREEEAASGEMVPDDRVRLTNLSPTTWGLSVKRHTGRWEKTPFSGSMKEILDTVWTFMQHLVAPY